MLFPLRHLISKLYFIINLFSCIIISTFIFCNNPIKANADTLPSKDIFNKKQPVNFKADSISYNNNLKLFIATGNITITQGNQYIKADKAYIERDKNYIFAKGNVVFKDNKGQLIFSDEIEIKNTLNNVIIKNIHILFPDNSLMYAKTVTKNNNIITACGAGYTACSFSKFLSPFWSIKASKITYNQQSDIINFYNGWLNFKNIPVFWIPYISYSTDEANRKFGLMPPSIGKTTALGYYYRQPIFFPINRYTDLYLHVTYFRNSLPFFNESSFNSSINPLFQANFDTYLPETDIKIKSFYTPNTTNDWAIFSSITKNINNIFRSSINYNNASSRTFLTLYDINAYSSKDSFLDQNINLEGFLSKRDYLSLQLISTKNINTLISTKENPYILPYIKYDHFGNNNQYGKLDFNLEYSNFVNKNIFNNQTTLPNNNDFDINKLVLLLKHTVLKETNFGVFTLNSELQSSNYYKAYLNNNSTNNNMFDRYLGGSISLQAKYPIVSTIGSYSTIINPIVQLSYSNFIYNKIHNFSYLETDTTETTDLNLFESNKYTGYDYYEKAKKLNYGLQWNLINKDGFSGQMLVGQSLNLENQTKSNYLLYLSLDPFSFLRINYTASINSSLRKIEQSNLHFSAGNNLLRTAINYRLINNLNPKIHNVSYLEELEPSFSVQLTSSIRFSAVATFNLRNNSNSSLYRFNNLQSFDTILFWENNCFSFSIEMSRKLYGDTQTKHSNSYQVSFTFKNLGK